MRLPRIDLSDLSLFEFDYDLTMMVFFLDAEERVYARYGGRDAEDAESRMSLKGLKYTMQSVLAAHRSGAKEFAPRSESALRNIRDVAGGGGRCLHCHQVKEALQRKLVADGEWTRDRVFRYPLPENLGFRLEVHRGDRVESVAPQSPAARAGVQPGDRLRKLGAVPIHSFADAQFALDKAPPSGSLPIRFERDGKHHDAQLALAEGWRKSDITWRPSLRRLIPAFPLYGEDLPAAERARLGLAPKALAFRVNNRLGSRAQDAGFRPGDLVLDLDGRGLQLSVDDLLDFVKREYLVGDTLQVAVRRGEQRVTIPLTLANR